MLQASLKENLECMQQYRFYKWPRANSEKKGSTEDPCPVLPYEAQALEACIHMRPKLWRLVYIYFQGEVLLS